jgi:hypothetical protein
MSRIRTAVGWTIVWFVVAGEVSLPLAWVRMPHGGSPCQDLWAHPGWAIWVMRDTLWFSMAVVLPVSVALAAALAWRTGLSTRRCTAIGAGIGAGLVLTSVVTSMFNVTCGVDIYVS